MKPALWRASHKLNAATIRYHRLLKEERHAYARFESSGSAEDFHTWQVWERRTTNACKSMDEAQKWYYATCARARNMILRIA